MAPDNNDCSTKSGAGKSERRALLSGYTLTELFVSMGLSAILATSFFSVFLDVSSTLQQETIVGQYNSTVNQALFQFARDFRLAGANPTGNPFLFDGDPAKDVAIEIDPDGDTNIHNALLIRADKKGLTSGEADGDTEDTLETVMIHYDPKTARLWRHTWRVPPEESGLEIQDHKENQAAYDASPFLEGICSFDFSYLDAVDRTTTVADQVASVVVELTSASGPKECFESHSFTRSHHALIRIRNR